MVSGATGTGRIRSMVTRAMFIGAGVGMRSAAHVTSEAGADPCCMRRSQGPRHQGW